VFLFRKKYNYECKCHRRRDSFSSFSEEFTAQKMVNIAMMNHSPLCFNILKNIAVITEKAYISGNTNLPIRNTHDFPLNETYYTTFSDAFVKQVSDLTQDIVINNEVQYLKVQETYFHFLASPFFAEIKSKIDAFITNGSTFYAPKDVAHCDIQKVDAGAYCKPNLNYSNNFYMCLITSHYDSDYGHNHRINIIDNTHAGYRPLSPVETSMLSVALAETFPQLFSVTWNLHITETAPQNWSFEYHLIPKWIFSQKNPTEEVSTFYKDIY